MHGVCLSLCCLLLYFYCTCLVLGSQVVGVAWSVRGVVSCEHSWLLSFVVEVDDLAFGDSSHAGNVFAGVIDFLGDEFVEF